VLIWRGNSAKNYTIKILIAACNIMLYSIWAFEKVLPGLIPVAGYR
jgi:hypothetical protein